MNFFTFLLAIGLAIESLVSSLPLDCHDHHHRNHYHHANSTCVVHHSNSSTTTIAHHQTPEVQISTVTTHNVTRRAQDTPPSVRQMMVWLTQTKGWKGENCVFYTTPGSYSDASSYASKIGGYWWGTAFKDSNNEAMLYQWSKSDGSNELKVSEDMSEAMAEVATSPTYLMITKDATPRSDNIWAKREEPTLKRRGITVKAVDPSTGEVWNDNFLG